MKLFGSKKPDLDQLVQRNDVEGLLKALTFKEEYNVRCRIISHLGFIEDPRAVDPLTNILMNDPDDRLRWEAARSLGIIGGSKKRFMDRSKAIDPLLLALRNCNNTTQLKQIIADSLGYIHDSKAVDALICLSKDDRRCVKDAAIAALGEIGDECAVDVLVQIIKKDEMNKLIGPARQNVGTPHRTMEEAVLALGKISFGVYEDERNSKKAKTALKNLDKTTNSGYVRGWISEILNSKVGLFRRNWRPGNQACYETYSYPNFNPKIHQLKY